MVLLNRMDMLWVTYNNLYSSNLFYTNVLISTLPYGCIYSRLMREKFKRSLIQIFKIFLETRVDFYKKRPSVDFPKSMGGGFLENGLPCSSEHHLESNVSITDNFSFLVVSQ